MIDSQDVSTAKMVDGQECLTKHFGCQPCWLSTILAVKHVVWKSTWAVQSSWLYNHLGTTKMVVQPRCFSRQDGWKPRRLPRCLSRQDGWQPRWSKAKWLTAKMFDNQDGCTARMVIQTRWLTAKMVKWLHSQGGYTTKMVVQPRCLSREDGWLPWWLKAKMVDGQNDLTASMVVHPRRAYRQDGWQPRCLIAKMVIQPRWCYRQDDW